MNNDLDLNGFERLFQALADRTRLRLLSLMADGPVSVGYLADQLGESQPKTSRHLAYLRNAGLVSTSREGKWIYYALDRQEDDRVQAVLDSTLYSISGTGDRLVDTRTNGEMGESYPSSDDKARSEWSPNEIEVYLL